MNGRHLQKYLLILIIIVVLLGVVIVPVESGHMIRTTADGLWWAITTVTTVGYGDLVPVTPAGRTIGALLMVGGIVMFWLVMALITAAFTKKQEKYLAKKLRLDLDSINNKLYRLENKLNYLIKEKKGL